MSNTPWLCYIPDDGFTFHATREEAVAEAESRIDGFLDDTWNEDVEGIIVAHITDGVARTNVVHKDDPRWDELTGYRTDIEFWCDYTMTPYLTEGEA